MQSAIPEIPAAIKELLDELVGRGHEVWIFGSRVNGRARPDSDWDVLIFGDAELLQELKQRDEVPDCDAMVVVDGDDFRKPWGRRLSDGSMSGGRLSKWEWERKDDVSATYKATKWPEDAEHWQVSRQEAVRYAPNADADE